MTGIPVAPGELVDTTYLNEIARAHYRKTTAKAVVSSTAETDLLNGEITIGAGALAASRLLRLTAFGDAVNNSGSAQKAVQWKLKFGGTTLIDTGTMTSTTSWAATSSRFGWRVEAEIMNLGVTNVQVVKFHLLHDGSFINGQNGLIAGEGLYTADTQHAYATALGYAGGTLDTTLVQALVLSVTLPASSASLDVTLKGAIVEIV